MTAHEPPAHAVIYAAKSTEDKHGSIPTQIDDCRKLAECDGLDPVAQFQDESASAFKGNRGPNLARAMAEVVRLKTEHGEAALIVQHSDRLARGDGKQAKHLIEYALWALQAGVTIRSVQDDQTFGDLLYAVVTGQRNHEDSARKSKSVRDGLRRRKEGDKPVGPVPFGYVPSPKLDAEGKPVVDSGGKVINERVECPERGPVVRRIFDLAEAGETPGSIARTLNAEGIRARPRGRDTHGKRWDARPIRELLRRPAYAGQRGYPAIIDPERWERINAQSRRLDPVTVQRRKGGRPAADHSYLLRGLVFCPHCGEALWTRTLARGREYICPNVRKATGTCRAVPIPAGQLEGRVLGHLDSFVGNLHDWAAERLDAHHAEHEAKEAAVERERAALAALDRQRERHLAEYDRLVDEGSSSLARIALERVERLDRDREAQQHALSDAEAVAGEWAGSPDLDAVLDFYNELGALVAGTVKQARGAPHVRDRLRQLLTGIWAEVVDGRLRVQFGLRYPEGDSDRIPMPDNPFANLAIPAGSHWCRTSR